MKDLITINPKDIGILQNEGGQLLFKKKAEDSLIKLLMIKEMIDSAIDNAKLQIAEAGMALDPGFKGIEGEKIRVGYRRFGEKYEYDWKKKDELGAFLTKKEYYKVNSDKVDEYLTEVGEMPDGITEKDREKVLTIKLMEEKDELI